MSQVENTTTRVTELMNMIDLGPTQRQHPSHPRLPPSPLPLPVTLNKMFTRLPSSLQTVGEKMELSMEKWKHLAG